jgi:hypothetical protein
VSIRIASGDASERATVVAAASPRAREMACVLGADHDPDALGVASAWFFSVAVAGDAFSGPRATTRASTSRSRVIASSRDGLVAARPSPCASDRVVAAGGSEAFSARGKRRTV